MADRRMLYVLLFACLLRLLTSIHPYSGQSKPPMFGDYEAQRHWMEITYHLPIGEWYSETERNPLAYWGLDYPPLTAYHSLLNAAIAARINSSWIELPESRGLESYDHKLFMRYTVLASDVLVFLSALYFYFQRRQGDRNLAKAAHFLAAAAYPGLILIDHGHFQYNCVALGLTLWAVIALEAGQDGIGSVLFVLALNYKQMSLYHALPFFSYLLGKCLRLATPSKRVAMLLALGTSVLSTAFLLWLPLLLANGQAAGDALRRLFPFDRGVFEDKVANLWCTLSVFVKFRFWPRQLMVWLAGSTTLVVAALPAFDLLLRPSIVRFKYCLLNVSLIFFLCSYQVHEKSILLPALPALLLLRLDPAPISCFLVTTVSSMFPLLLKDGLALAAAALTLFYIVYADWLCFASSPGGERSKAATSAVDWLTSGEQRLLVSLSYALQLSLCVLCAFAKPPPRYPDLFPVILSACCFLHFSAFLLYFVVCQLRIPTASPTSQAIIIAAKSKKHD